MDDSPIFMARIFMRHGCEPFHQDCVQTFRGIVLASGNLRNMGKQPLQEIAAPVVGHQIRQDDDGCGKDGGLVVKGMVDVAKMEGWSSKGWVIEKLRYHRKGINRQRTVSLYRA